MDFALGALVFCFGVILGAAIASSNYANGFRENIKKELGK